MTMQSEKKYVGNNHLKFIEIMISAAKEGKLSDDESCFLALSTVYGLRREEMRRLSSNDIDFKHKNIFINTAMGRQRCHLIPKEIKTYLERHDFNKHYSDTAMSQMFWRIINKSGAESFKSEKLGWHAIRRTLITLLHQSRVDPFTIHQFVGWKGTECQETQSQSDKEVFKKHPLLEFWRVMNSQIYSVENRRSRE